MTEDARTMDRWILPALLLLNSVIKFCWLGVNELSGDEPFTVFWSQRSSADLFDMLRSENNPPLYFLLMKAWSALVPMEEAWLRVPSAVFSVLTVWPLYLLARALGGRSVAITAALLFTFSNYHFGFAHEVRAYSLFTLLATTGMWLLVRGAGKPRNGLRAMLGLSALNVVLVYTHFFGWLAIGVQLLCVLVILELRPLRRNFLLGMGLTAGYYLPYATIFLGRMGASVSKGTWLTSPAPEELYNMIWRWSNAPVVAVCFLLIIVVVVARTRARELGMRIGLVWAFVPLVGMFAVSFAVPMFLDRYLVYTAPGFAVLVAVCIGSVAQEPRLPLALSGLAGIGMLVTFTPWKGNGTHPSRVVKQVNEWRSGPVLIHPGWYDLTYLWALGDHDCFFTTPDQQEWCMGKGQVWTIAGDDLLPIDPAKEQEVVLVDAASTVVDPGQMVKRSLRAALPQVDSVEADKKVWVYRFRR